MNQVQVLLVEDNAGDILLIKEAFEDVKVNEIKVLRDGEKAINYLDQNEEFRDSVLPDLIILDINLPRKSGHEVLKFIKYNEKLKAIPVIMLTTSSSDNDIAKSYENYVNCYITKPVEGDEFLKAITTIENFWINLVKLPTSH